jgi:hypothetical protein
VPCFQLEWKHFGLAGGSYFRTEAVVDAFDPAHVQRIDWGPMQWREGDKTMSSDFAMIVAFACRGWKVFPWNESAQNFERRGQHDGAAELAQALPVGLRDPGSSASCHDGWLSGDLGDNGSLTRPKGPGIRSQLGRDRTEASLKHRVGVYERKPHPSRDPLTDGRLTNAHHAADRNPFTAHVALLALMS